MTLAELRASLKRARQKARHHGQLARKNKKLASRRRRQIKERTTGPSGALYWALRQVGEVESPSGSNRGPKITMWQSEFGSWLVGQPWCGVFVGTALKRVKVPVNSRVAGVALICEDAEKCVNGWKSFTRNASAAEPGDAVVLFGRGTHVGLVVENDKVRKVLHTVEGNTSPGTAGSQDNGGGVYLRTRPYAVVYGIAKPRY